VADSFKSGAFSQNAFAPAAFDFDEADPNALVGSFASGFTGAADLTLSAQVIPITGGKPRRRPTVNKPVNFQPELARRRREEEALFLTGLV